MSDSVRIGLLVFPYNGNAMEAAHCIGDAFDLVAFVDDEPEKQGPSAYGCPVLGRSALDEFSAARVLAVPGSPASYRARRGVIDGLGVDAHRFARVIHPQAAISPVASLGYNLLVMAGAVVTSNAVIGNHVCLLPNCVVHHDVSIGDWTLVGANVAIAGGVEIGENCYIGSGTSIKNGVRIGTGALVGLGSTIIRDVPPGAIVAGNPARALR